MEYFLKILGFYAIFSGTLGLMVACVRVSMSLNGISLIQFFSTALWWALCWPGIVIWEDIKLVAAKWRTKWRR